MKDLRKCLKNHAQLNHVTKFSECPNKSHYNYLVNKLKLVYNGMQC